MMKYIVLLLACVAFVRADQWNELNLDDESEARLLFNTNGTGSSLIPDGRAILGFVLVGVLLFALLGGQNLLPAERQQQYGDYYNQEYAQDYQTFSARYGLADLATRMQQLESVFKKFEVEAEECQEFIACEAAQLRKLKTNVPVVQIVNRIMSTADDKIAPRLTAAFQYGLEQQNQPRACYELRQRCYVAHNNQ